MLLLRVNKLALPDNRNVQHRMTPEQLYYLSINIPQFLMYNFGGNGLKGCCLEGVFAEW